MSAGVQLVRSRLWGHAQLSGSAEVHCGAEQGLWHATGRRAWTPIGLAGQPQRPPCSSCTGLTQAAAPRRPLLQDARRTRIGD